MIKKIALIITLFFSSLMLSFSAQAQSVNLGVIDGIWFSEDYYAAGDDLRIYTAVQNKSGVDIVGEVFFFDNKELIGSKEFQARDDRIVDVWIDTEAREGERSFEVSFENITGSDGSDVSSLVSGIENIESSLRIFVDTDRDEIPDDEDLDDDNDGYTDREEQQAGSDPLDAKSIPQEDEDQKRDSPASLTEEDRSGPIPDLVLNTTEKYPVITPVVSGLNTLQNVLLTEVDRVQERRVIKVEGNQQEGEEPRLTKKTLVDQGLSIANWLLSCFWCMAVVLLIIIYFLIKIIFKVITRR